MSKQLKSEVRKALEEIKYDDWHDNVHREAMFKAQKELKLSEKEQSVFIRCGVCDKTLEFRVPPTITDHHRQTKRG